MRPCASVDDGARLKLGAHNFAATTDRPPQDGLFDYRVTSVNELGSESGPSQMKEAVSDSQGPRVLHVEYPPEGNVDALSGRVAPGLVALVVRFSEALRTRPYFALVPDGGVPNIIELSKDRNDDTLYKGNFVVEPSTPSGQMFAVMSAHDALGNRGTTIEEGQSLLIDTRGPEVLDIITSPLHPIRVEPTEPASARTVDVSIVLSDEVKSGEQPRLVPFLKSVAVAGYENGVELARDADSTEGNPTWRGSFVLPANAGLDGDGQPLVQVLSFTHVARDDLGNETTRIRARNLIQVYQGDLPPVAIPFGLSATAIADGRVQLAWQPVEGAAGHRLYRQAFDETSFTELTSKKESTATR